MRNRLATYIEAAFPFPAAYQSDGAGGLTLLPPLRIPTKIVQAQQAFSSPTCGRKKPCACHGRCGGCKGLRGLGDPTDPNDPSFDYGSLSFPDNSTPPPAPNDFGEGDLNAVLNAPPDYTPTSPSNPFGLPGQTTPSGTNPNSVPALINALAQAGGRIIASTRGITQQQFAAQNPQLSPAQAAAQYQKLYGTQQMSIGGAGISTIVGGLPIWGWGLGLLAVSFVGAQMRGGK